MPLRAAAKVLLLCAPLALAACTVAEFFSGREGDRAELGLAADPAFAQEELGAYLELMRLLIQAEPIAQAEIFLQIAEAAASSPTTVNRLKLALALATPGHPSSDAAAAERMLSDLLTAGVALLPEERTLISVQLAGVEERLRLAEQAEQAREALAAGRTEWDNENSRRLDTALAENAELKRQLQEAQQKLDAITNIERSIRERENGTDP